MTSKQFSYQFAVVVTGLLVVMGRSSTEARIGTGSYLCEPDVDCTNNGIGAQVPDPEDCDNYYLCVNSSGVSKPSSVPIQCPTNQSFDYASGSCKDTTTPCENLCINHCNAYCVNDFDELADPNSCSVFYICIGDVATPTSCSDPEFPYFNGTTCTNDSYSCCDICTPYCEKENVETFDPLDCRSFYVCLQIGIPGDEYRGTCDSGHYFDPQVGTCVTGAICDTLCSTSATTMTSLPSSSPPSSETSASSSEPSTSFIKSEPSDDDSDDIDSDDIDD